MGDAIPTLSCVHTFFFFWKFCTTREDRMYSYIHIKPNRNGCVRLPLDVLLQGAREGSVSCTVRNPPGTWPVIISILSQYNFNSNGLQLRTLGAGGRQATYLTDTSPGCTTTRPSAILASDFVLSVCAMSILWSVLKYSFTMSRHFSTGGDLSLQ